MGGPMKIEATGEIKKEETEEPKLKEEDIY